MSIIKRPAYARGRSDNDWLTSRHTFSFGEYFDPAHTGYRSLRVINDDIVAPGQGFGQHGHRDAEIVTYVLEGSLEHRDSMGNGRILRAGDLQYMSAGRGVLHSEFNPSVDTRVHFLQIWLVPRISGGEPRYAEKSLAVDAQRDGLTLMFAGTPRDGAMAIRADADVYFGRIAADGSIGHPLRTLHGVWLHVIKGNVAVMAENLGAGDGASIEGIDTVEMESATGAEFLLFDMP